MEKQVKKMTLVRMGINNIYDIYLYSYTINDLIKQNDSLYKYPDLNLNMVCIMEKAGNYTIKSWRSFVNSEGKECNHTIIRNYTVVNEPPFKFWFWIILSLIIFVIITGIYLLFRYYRNRKLSVQKRYSGYHKMERSSEIKI